jgi:hypothetical protein
MKSLPSVVGIGQQRASRAEPEVLRFQVVPPELPQSAGQLPNVIYPICNFQISSPFSAERRERLPYNLPCCILF